MGRSHQKPPRWICDCRQAASPLPGIKRRFSRRQRDNAAAMNVHTERTPGRVPPRYLPETGSTTNGALQCGVVSPIVHPTRRDRRYPDYRPKTTQYDVKAVRGAYLITVCARGVADRLTHAGCALLSSNCWRVIWIPTAAFQYLASPAAWSRRRRAR